MAATAVEIFTDPSIVQAAKNELNQRVGDDFIYKALLGERSPPLNYRVN
jgi:aminobenzoyl-glutamate utilization protein B